MPEDDRRSGPPTFDARFQEKLETLFRWRRDVRRFRRDPLDPAILDGLFAQAALAPSVGNSQPWRFVKVSDKDRRARVRDIFQRCNKNALDGYEGERAKLYASLKLSGLDAAPVHVAVFVDDETDCGHGLGRQTMPETLSYSVVTAIHTFWLAARAQGVGVGWLSIVEPDEVRAVMDVPETWSLVAYLCVGYPEEEHDDPELVRAGWQDRIDLSRFVVER